MAQNNLLLDQPFQRTYQRKPNPRKFIQQMLTSEDTYATVLLVFFVDRYGMEALDWHPGAIKLQLQQDFGVQLSKSTLDRLMAAIAVVTTNAFFRDTPQFIELCNVLAGDDFDPTVFEPADSAEMAWAVAEAMLLFPPEDPMPFSDEIRGYVGKVLKDEGYVRPPKILRFATDADFVEQIKYDFTSDPEMFQAIYKNQSEKADEIDVLVMDNLQELLTQLTSLPLHNGDTSQIKDRIRAGLKQ